MARKVWRHTMTVKEQRLWKAEDMEGWRTSLIQCVEDEAREEGCKKFILYDRQDTVVAKDIVSTLPEPEPIEA